MKMKALVVDDNDNNLLLEKDLLEVAGFEVFEAENAVTGIAIARRIKPDVIIMDIRLPDMRGTEAARILRQDNTTCDIPIVFVTSSVMVGGSVEINAIPNSRLIGKPINTRTFVKDISQFIEIFREVGCKEIMNERQTVNPDC
jgi:CheY-like chemotaxis protein